MCATFVSCGQHVSIDEARGVVFSLQPALVAEVLHNPDVDKVKEAYDSVSVVSAFCS